MSLLEANPLIVRAEERSAARRSTPRSSTTTTRWSAMIGSTARNIPQGRKEIEASKFDLADVVLIGIVAHGPNGAGLAMAMMDIIKLYARSGKTLDVGGGASRER